MYDLYSCIKVGIDAQNKTRTKACYAAASKWQSNEGNSVAPFLENPILTPIRLEHLRTTRLPLLSQHPVVLAAITSANPALSTFEDVVGKTMMAFLAAIRTTYILPVLMDAIMPLSKHLDRCHNALHSIFDTSPFRTTIDDDVCTCEEILFIPLGTGAGLPFQTAYIAELGSASASVTDQLYFRRGRSLRT
jgi:hypothetical protein